MSEALNVVDIAMAAQKRRPEFHVPWHPELMRYAAAYKRAAASTSAVDACMLAAIVLRESGGQNILQHGMPPGPDCGVGVCQITFGVDWSDLVAPIYPGYGSLLDPEINIRVAASEFLDPLLARFAGNHIAAFAAYNCGPGAVEQALRAGHSPDSVTTGKDYGSDIFRSWINFSAASLGLKVNWAGYAAAKPASTATTPVVSGTIDAPPISQIPIPVNGGKPYHEADSDLTDY